MLDVWKKNTRFPLGAARGSDTDEFWSKFHRIHHTHPRPAKCGVWFFEELFAIFNPHQRCEYSDSLFARKDTCLYCRVWKWVGGEWGRCSPVKKSSKCSNLDTKITKIKVSTFWMSGKSTDSRRRPMPAFSRMSFKHPAPFFRNVWPR